MKTHSKRRNPGFTLLELVVVIAIISIILGIAIPMFSASKETSELRSIANQLVGNFKQAQALARSGKADVPVWPANTRAQAAGIRFISATQYAIFVDQDNLSNGAGSEADIEVVDIAPNGEPFAFVSPPAQVRFKKNGTLPTPPDITVTVRNTNTNQTKVVQVTYGGQASIL